MDYKNHSQTVLNSVKIDNSFSFSNNTTYGCGGKAEHAYYPETVEHIVAVYDYLKSNGKKFVILGNGSNVLASDRGFDGDVISCKRLKGIEPVSQNSLLCYAGTSVAQLLKFCKINNCGGLEYLAGIPATCGGLVYMNGGAAGKYICENVKSVHIYDGDFKILTNKSCRFGNKHSIMRDIDCVILAVELVFIQKKQSEIESDINYYLSKRRVHPTGKSCGCVFKNTDGISAGKLIDDVGLKGLSIGKAKVSAEHANFIINTGTCAFDVYALIKEVKRRVFDKTGVLLEEEVVYIGDFNDSFG